MIGTIPKTRRVFTRSHKQLRRGRNLYFRMIRAAVGLDATGQNLVILAKRMQDCGLYSKFTRMGDIQFMILKKIYLFDNACQPGRFDNFEHWRRKNGWKGWVFFGFTRSRIK